MHIFGYMEILLIVYFYVFLSDYTGLTIMSNNVIALGVPHVDWYRAKVSQFLFIYFFILSNLCCHPSSLTYSLSSQINYILYGQSFKYFQKK